MFSRYPCSDTKLVNVTLHRTVYSQQYTKQTPYYVTLSAAVDFKYRRTTRKSFKSAIQSSYILPAASNQTFTAPPHPSPFSHHGSGAIFALLFLEKTPEAATGGLYKKRYS